MLKRCAAKARRLKTSGFSDGSDNFHHLSLSLTISTVSQNFKESYETLLFSCHLLHGLGFNCDLQTLFGQGERPLINFNAFWNCDAKFHTSSPSSAPSLNWECSISGRFRQLSAHVLETQGHNGIQENVLKILVKSVEASFSLRRTGHRRKIDVVNMAIYNKLFPAANNYDYWIQTMEKSAWGSMWKLTKPIAQ